MEPLLRFENVSKHYPNGVHALKGVSFEMAEGEFISVIGPSGSGKSTLLRAINRLIPISGGTVWLDGQAVSAQRGAALRQLRRKVGMIDNFLPRQRPPALPGQQPAFPPRNPCPLLFLLSFL